MHSVEDSPPAQANPAKRPYISDPEHVVADRPPGREVIGPAESTALDPGNLEPAPTRDDTRATFTPR